MSDSGASTEGRFHAAMLGIYRVAKRDLSMEAHNLKPEFLKLFTETECGVTRVRESRRGSVGH